MLNILFSGLGRKRNELFLISFCVILFLSHAAVPFLKYPFLVVYLIISLYILTDYRQKIISGLKDLRTSIPLVLVLSLYFILACFFSEKIYLMVIKDIINIIILLSLMFFLKIFISDSDDFRLFYKSLLQLVILFALIISVQRLYSFFYASTYTEVFNDQYIHKDRAIVDNNFALVPVFFGFLAIVFVSFQNLSKSKKIVYNCLLFVFSLNYLFSGSKRGVLLFIIFFFFLVVVQLWSLFSDNLKIKSLSKNSRYYILSFSLSVILLALLIFNTSVYFKNSVLENIGIKNISFTKNLISETVFRYVHFFDKNIDGNKFYYKFWRPVFDPKDPETWDGNGNYKITRTITGKNAEIVPAGTKGYLLDNACLGFASATHSYYFLKLKNENVKTGDSLIASVFCYVSEDFDGDAAALRAEGSLTGNRDKWYDLKNKGCWQKLTLPLNCLDGGFTLYLYMNKGGVSNFSKLKGYVIFAYPESKMVSSDQSPNNTSKQGESYNVKRFKENLSVISGQKPDLSSSGLNFLTKAGFFSFSMNKIFTKINIANDSDPVRVWFARLVSEDTTYHGYRANLFVNKSMDNFGDDRIARWKFAVQIFDKEYSWSQKIFGGGFSFLNWYGYFFLSNKTKTDYPHNPFLFILLYSGIIGLIFYVIFLFKVFYYYIKYSKEYPLFFIFFLITFYFTFFSGGNPFDPPIMGFFVILPFIMHSIFKNTKTELNSLN